MGTFVLTLHVILSLLLVFIILMQPGKGADPSSAFGGGGGGAQLFGAAGPGNLLTRGTGVIATLFMITSITLAFQSTKAAQSGGGVDLNEPTGEEEAGQGFGVGEAKPADAPAAAPADAPVDAPPVEAPPVEAPPVEAPPAPTTP